MPKASSRKPIDKDSIIEVARDCHAIFRQYSEKYHFFRHDEYAGFDIARKDGKEIVEIHYLSSTDHGDDEPRRTSLGTMTIDLDDILAFPANFIDREHAIMDYTQYVIDRDERKHHLKELANSIANTNKRIDEVDKEISALENPASIDEKVHSLRRMKDTFINNVKQYLAEKKHVEEQIEKFLAYTGKASEEDLPKTGETTGDPETTDPDQ